MSDCWEGYPFLLYSNLQACEVERIRELDFWKFIYGGLPRHLVSTTLIRAQVMLGKGCEFAGFVFFSCMYVCGVCVCVVCVFMCSIWVWCMQMNAHICSHPHVEPRETVVSHHHSWPDSHETDSLTESYIEAHHLSRLTESAYLCPLILGLQAYAPPSTFLSRCSELTLRSMLAQ